jgi:hypothetical protein
VGLRQMYLRLWLTAKLRADIPRFGVFGRPDLDKR